MTAPPQERRSQSAGERYVSAVIDLLLRRDQPDSQTLDVAARWCADAISGGHLVHLFGAGHSALPVLELFPRYGSFIGLNPIVDPRLLWFGVNTPGGVPGMRYLEDAPGYAQVVLRSVPINEGDVFLVFSHGLRSRLVKEALAYAHSKGCRTIAISSSAASGHEAGQRPEPVDTTEPQLIVDTRVPPSDTMVTLVEGSLDGFGAGSSVVATVLGLALVCATGEQLVARGFDLEQSRRTGAGLNEQDWAFYEGFDRSIREAWGKSETSAGEAD